MADRRGGFTFTGYVPGSRILYAIESFDSDNDDPATLQRLLQGKGEKLEIEKAGDHQVQLKLVRRE